MASLKAEKPLGQVKKTTSCCAPNVSGVTTPKAPVATPKVPVSTTKAPPPAPSPAPVPAPMLGSKPVAKPQPKPRNQQKRGIGGKPAKI